MGVPTLPTPLVGALIKPFYRLSLNASLPVAAQRKLIDWGAVLQPLLPGALVAPITLGGRPAERVTFGNSRPTTAVLYLHGGGYVVGSMASHRSLATHIAKKSGAAVYVLDYRLAPEHRCPAAVDDAVAAFRDLIDNHGYDAGSIAIAGDSAGGGLALATAQQLVAGVLTPAALGLIAPWVDPNAVTARRTDLVITHGWSRFCAAEYLGDGDRHSTTYAPLHGELAGLPPTLIQIGTKELLYTQAIDLTNKLRDAGVDVWREDSPTLWHVAQVQASLVREAAEAVSRMAEFLSSHAVGVEPGTSHVS